MASLDMRIADLEEEIEGYKAEYKTASSEAIKDRLRQTIITRTETLNSLLDEKKAQSRSN